MKDMRTLGIVGSGQMGSGIGQVAAQAGFSVVLFDVTQQIVNRAMEQHPSRISPPHGARANCSEEEQRAILGRFRGTANLNDLRDVDLVIEAAPEDYEIKKSIFQQLDQITRPETILASNTSSISLTQLGAVTKRPEKVIGMHFMNPPVVMQLVEIVRGLATADETLQVVDALGQENGQDHYPRQRLCGIHCQPHSAAHD